MDGQVGMSKKMLNSANFLHPFHPEWIEPIAPVGRNSR
ncbi:MAG: hypothetical protein FD149_668 [Rhodospirillaceae bacterium]|nr:MAG: hypothetical protein FD149_668 [Rhodospirillaceae bacterium]